MSGQSGAPQFDLVEDDVGRLMLRRPGQDDAVGVTLRRAFPWTSPGRFVSIRSKDGKELLLIDDLAGLAGPLRSVIDRWLARHNFIPRILRVRSIDVDFGYQQWSVETDRGPVEFRVQEREDVRFLHDGRFTVRDADGNVYELDRLDRLERDTRRVLETLL